MKKFVSSNSTVNLSLTKPQMYIHKQIKWIKGDYNNKGIRHNLDIISQRWNINERFNSDYFDSQFFNFVTGRMYNIKEIRILEKMMLHTCQYIIKLHTKTIKQLEGATPNGFMPNSKTVKVFLNEIIADAQRDFDYVKTTFQNIKLEIRRLTNMGAFISPNSRENVYE